MEKDYMKSDMWGTCIWGIDDTGRLFIGDGVAASLVNELAPWEQYKEEITAVETFGTVFMPKGASLAGLFKGCRNLEKVNLKDFNTSGVVDMSAMFEDCENLKELDLSSFNTINVRDMNHMFCGCRSLSNLDLSSFNTTRTNDMTAMFSRCGVLHSLVLTETFKIDGDGTTSCGNISVRDTGKYKIAKVVNAGSSVITYHENYGRPGKLEKKSMYGMDHTIEKMVFPAPGPDFVFTGWNTASDGSGVMFAPGDELQGVDDDLELYAIWVGVPKIGTVQALTEIEYGMQLPFELPEITSINDDSVSGHLEISKTGEEDSWIPIERRAILPASYNGYLLRLVAKNKVGTAYSNTVRIRIKKAGIDISRVHWVESESMIYDGQSKSVWLEGIPDGVKAIYKDNEAIEVGEYCASVILEYDSENYHIPVKIRDHIWSINKAVYDMSAVRWSYEKPFLYDGQLKEIRLTGLPGGVEASYEDNTASAAGVMTAIATLSYDTRNYERPIDVIPCIWEIKKAVIDTKSLKWKDCSAYVYDGTSKRVFLENLPADAVVEYSGEEETLAGKYLARARLCGNYYSTTPIEYEWEIAKAKYDMSEVEWNYQGPFVFDKNSHELKLVNVPAGLRVHYYNNVALRVGDYEARASFTSADSHNFTTPGDVTILWTIKKAVADMSAVKWDYSGPFTFDGESKTIELIGLPEGVYASYFNNNATNAGVYTAHASLKYDESNYEVEPVADCQWQINRAKIDISNVSWEYDGPYTYDGTAKGVKLINLPECLNVEYNDNNKIDSGKYVATAKLTPSDIANYEIPEINGCTWSISRFKLERGEIQWSEFDSFVYDGKEKSVAIVSDIDEKIRVEYTGNKQVNAGKYTARASFFPVDTANYSAPTDVTYEWKIEKSDIDTKEIVWDYSSAFVYDGSKKQVKLLNVPEGLIVHYENSAMTEAGDYTAIAHFEVMNSENYNDVADMSLNWTIQKSTYDMSKAQWTEKKEFVYSGQAYSVELVGLPEGIEPIYVGNEAINAGEHIASVDFNYDDKNYEKPEFVSCRWKIVKADLNPGSSIWNYSEPFIYDGNEKKVKVVNIPEGAHVEYSNISASATGTYIALAELIAEDSDNYNNISLEPLTWKIIKGEYDMSHAYWDYDKPFTYDGREKMVVLKGLPEGVFPAYQGNAAVEAGNYVASVSFKVADNDNYNIPEFDSCEWNIGKADYDMSAAQWSYAGEFTYNGRMHEIVLRGLPEGVRAVYDGNCATNVGSYKASAKLIPYDEDNYNAPSVIDCNWEIVKADFDMSAVRWDYFQAKTYNERVQGVELENLPNGVFADYSGSDATEVGKYTAKAVLRVADAANYNVPAVGDCVWEIVNADIDMSQIKWNYCAEACIYDGNEKTVVLENLPQGVNASYKGNTAVNAGQYVATAEFTVDNPNYRIPESISLRWDIGKAICDISGVSWNYGDEFIYNGKSQGIELENIPAVLNATYKDNRAVDVGEYTAIASFQPATDNYEIPEDMYCNWVINKANIDISGVRWDYDKKYVYDNTDKTVVLAGVPSLLTVEYSGNVSSGAGMYLAHAELCPVDTHNYNTPTVNDCEWEILKADYDMSAAVWVNNGPFTYDSTTKSVYLEGLPVGVTPIYRDNTQLNAGSYTAHADFEYDEANFNEPIVKDCIWKIDKSRCDMSATTWDYENAFTYDGGEKSVKLINVPEQVIVKYENNVAVEAGAYEAQAVYELKDPRNYAMPTQIKGCLWQINRSNYDMIHAYWDYDKSFTYDGREKKVVLKGLPEGVFPIYQGNAAVEAGKYVADVSFKVADNDNYNIPEFDSCEWNIGKADYDMSATQWSYAGAFTYNGRMQEIVLVGLPEGVRAVYDGNCATNVGSYKASAKLIPYDEDNYNAPSIIDCNWEIIKADFDMSAVRWDYFQAKTYNERVQSVGLENLPNGVFADYSGSDATEVGKYTAKAVLRVADTANYNVPAVGDCAWEIVNADIDMSQIKWNYCAEACIYDGNEKTVVLENLPQGVNVSYKGNTAVNAGQYVATAEFTVDNPNYRIPESINFRWDIGKAVCDISGVRWNYGDEFIYNGKSQGIELENIPAVLKATYKDNRAVDVGEYTAIASFQPATDNYETPEDMYCNWVINKANIDISGVRWDYDKKFVYDNTDKTVVLAGVPSLLTVEYSGNVSSGAGMYIAHAELCPVDAHNFNAPTVNDCAWEILKADYDMSAAVWVNNGPFTYDGTAKSVYLEGLPVGVTPVYMDSTQLNAGSYTAHADFEYDEANFNEPIVKDCTWKIDKSRYDMSTIKWDYDKAFVYDGSEKELVLKGIPKGLTAVYSGNRQTEADTYVASANFEYDSENFEKPSIEGCRWTIDQAEIAVNLDALCWDYDKAFTYDGNSKTVTLKESTSELSFLDKLRGRKPVVGLLGVPDGVEAFYEDNTQTDVGVYYAKAVLRHTTNRNYKEFIVPACEWEIKKSVIDMSDVRWDYDKAFTYDGSEKSIQLINIPDQVTVKYEDNVAVESGSYEAKALYELKDPKNYAIPMSMKVCWWQINKAKYDMSNAAWNYDDNVVYSGKEKTVRVVGLPEGVKVEAYSGNKAIEAGSYTAEALFRYKNPENYEAPELPALRWKIHKKKLDTSELKWSFDEKSLFVYDGQVKEVKLVGIPKGVEVVYINNSKINAGEYIAKARLTYDTKNFEAEPVPDCRWTIERASLDTSKVHWSYEKPFAYDAYEKTILLRNVPSQIEIRYRDNKASAVGTYTAKAYLTYDTENYNPPEIDTTIDWEIVRIGSDEK